MRLELEVDEKEVRHRSEAERAEVARAEESVATVGAPDLIAAVREAELLRAPSKRAAIGRDVDVGLIVDRTPATSGDLFDEDGAPGIRHVPGVAVFALIERDDRFVR